MGVWHLSADTLAQSRFAVSALAETVAVFHALNGNGAHPSQRAYVDRHVAAYREHLAADAFHADFVAALSPNWVPDFMFRPPWPEDRTFHDEIRRVRQTSPEIALADLAGATKGAVPAGLRENELPERVADLLDWVWTHVVRPDWPRRMRMFEADVVSRTQQLSTGGWAEALSGLRRGMRWLGKGRLQINTYENPPRDLTGARLLFIPTTARRGWVAWDQPHRYAVVYPCSGLLAEHVVPPVPEALSRLLGPVRAGILAELDTPKSTTQLVALTGFGLGSVGGHLKVLLDAELVRRRRSGRSVLYYRTPAGDHLAGVRPHPETSDTAGQDR